MDESDASPIPDKMIENILWKYTPSFRLSTFGRNKGKVFVKHQIVQSIELVEFYLEPSLVDLEPVI